MARADETRRLILEAAAQLFYSEGVRQGSVDAIAERAGVTKKTLYNHFPSKDHLIAAYLEDEHTPTLNRYKSWFDRFEGSFGDRVAAMFRELARRAADPRWKGCGFVRTAVELAGLPGHPAITVASRHKKAFESWLASQAAREGYAEPDQLARQVIILIDGAVTSMLIHRDPDYAVAAARSAELLIKHSMPRPARLQSARLQIC